MTLLSTRQYLDSFINYELKVNEMSAVIFKLDRVRELLYLLGNPQDKMKFIHIAGSKGKGSTCAFTASILRSAKYKIGLYTSPHLHDDKERIRVLEPDRTHSQENFEGKISDGELLDVLREMEPSIEKIHSRKDLGGLSYFEVYTIAAITYFQKMNVDFAVLETGMGGRLDATNVVKALVCGITPISLEHTQQLGETIAKIAREKAGIIKIKDQAVIIAPQCGEARQEIERRCQEIGALPVYVGQGITYNLESGNTDGQVFNIQGLKSDYRSLSTPLLGRHQAVNASVAIGIIESLQDMGFKIERNAIYDGIQNVVWPGRFEIVHKQPIVILDGAHNPDSCRTLVQSIQDIFPRKKVTLVLGISEDKDKNGIINELKKIVHQVILTRADHPRASQFTEDEINLFGQTINCITTESVAKAMDIAFRDTTEEEIILVTGSLFVVGEARELCTSSRI